MNSMLERIGAASRSRAAEAMRQEPLATHEEIIERLPPVRSLAARLTGEAGPPPRVIAEMKRDAPGLGRIREHYVPRQIAMGYARVGAAAVSVLTEPEEHGGDLAHLVDARVAHLPVLRKDFLVTPYQVAESRTSGADAVLLIVRLLQGPALGLMVHAARRYGIEALVEVQDEEELQRALDEGVGLVAVNNRDPEMREVNLDTSLRLAPRLPRGIVAVTEGGIRCREELDRLAGAGYEAFLIGETLMRSPDPGDALWSLMGPSG